MRARLPSRAAARVTEDGSPKGVGPREPELLTPLRVFRDQDWPFPQCTSRVRDHPVKAKLSPSLFITTYLRLLRVPWAAWRSNQTILKEINPIFIGRTDAEAENPILGPPDAKNWLTGKDPDGGKDWRQEEKGTTEDEMVGWQHRLSGHELEQTLGDSGGQVSLACYSPWGCKESDSTEWLTTVTICDNLWFFLVSHRFLPPFISDTSQSHHSLPTETDHKRYHLSVSPHA